MEAFASALVIGWLALNVGASLVALLAKDYSRQQRLLKVLFVWLLPVVGAVLVLCFTIESDKPPQPAPPDLANRSEFPAGSNPTNSHPFP
jgi:hypothetical protein